MKMRNKKNKISYIPHLGQVKCTCCGNYYKTIYFCDDQASQCASYIYLLHEIDRAAEKKSYIACEYGSGFDTTHFNIIDEQFIKLGHILSNQIRPLRQDENRRANDKDLLICDRCIESYIEKGWIVEDTNYDAFSWIEELNSFYAEDPQLYSDIMLQGPAHCLRLIREERAKPFEQRQLERIEREKTIVTTPMFKIETISLF